MIPGAFQGCRSGRKVFFVGYMVGGVLVGWANHEAKNQIKHQSPAGYINFFRTSNQKFGKDTSPENGTFSILHTLNFAFFYISSRIFPDSFQRLPKNPTLDLSESPHLDTLLSIEISRRKCTLF